MTHIYFRRSSSGDHLSITPDNLSPSPNPGGGNGGGLVSNKSAHRSLSNINSTHANGNGGQRSSGSTSYHSSTLPLRKHRNKVTSDEKNKKVWRLGMLVQWDVVSPEECVCMCMCVGVFDGIRETKIRVA